MLKSFFGFLFIVFTSLVAANDTIPLSIPDPIQFLGAMKSFASQVPNWAIYTAVGIVIFAGIAFVTPNKKDDGALKAMIAAFKAMLGKK